MKNQIEQYRKTVPILTEKCLKEFFITVDSLNCNKALIRVER